MAENETQDKSIVTATTQVNPAFWLNAAHGSVRGYCRWHVAPVITETLVLDGHGGKNLLIPSQRVKEIASVLNDGVDVTDQVKYSRTAGVLTLPRGWSRDVGAIEITLTHGYAVEEVPEIAALILNVAKRAGSGQSLIASQSVNGASVSYLTAGGAPLSVPLLQIEKDALAPYRLTWRP